MSPIIIRPATPTDLDSIARLRSLGFNLDQAEVRTNLENNPRYSYRNIIMAYLDGQAVGTSCVFPTQLWLSGVPVSMGSVAAVTTHPDYRHQGVFKAMMEHLLSRMHQEGLAISGLFPATHSLYNQFGYAPAAIWHAYSIKPNNLPPFAEAAHVRPFDPADLPAIRSIYRGGQLSQADGRVTRSAAHWDRLTARRYGVSPYQSVVYDHNGVEGYLKYLLTDNQGLKVEEMMVYSDAAYRGLWGFMAVQPGITTIDYLAPADDPILHMLKTPQDGNGGNRIWIFNDIYHATSSFMLRIIDLAEALTSRFYPSNMMGWRVLKIHDPHLPANAQPLKFRIVDGRSETQLVPDAHPDVETDILTFSQIYCGFLAPDTARRLGRLNADDETVLWLGQAMAARPLFMHKGDWF